jgi:hypothetical protein
VVSMMPKISARPSQRTQALSPSHSAASPTQQA